MENLEEYKREFESALVSVRQKIENKKNPKLNPFNISLRLFNNITSSNKDDIKSNSDLIRKFHDFYGWMSKGTAKNIGLCAGTCFRTSDYVSLNPNLRSGKKNDREKEIGIHVEHTIPVKVLNKILITNINLNSKPKDIFNLLMDYSVCTAFTRLNEKSKIIKGLHSRHPDFDENGSIPNINEVRPFIRYSSDLEIYSVITKKNIDKNLSLKELNLISKNNEIYKWEFVEKNYKH